LIDNAQKLLLNYMYLVAGAQQSRPRRVPADLQTRVAPDKAKKKGRHLPVDVPLALR